MTDITSTQARRLCVRYSAFNDANNKPVDAPGRQQDLVFWAAMLLDVQAETGIVMHEEATLRGIVRGSIWATLEAQHVMREPA